MTTSDIIRGARAIVAERWTAGKFGINGGPRCLMGAVYEAAGGGPVDGHPHIWRDVSALTVPALQRMAAIAGLCHTGELSTWNDVPGRTREDVLALCDRAMEGEL